MSAVSKIPTSEDDLRPSFFLFIKLYFVNKVQGPSDQFFIFVVMTRDMIISTTVIVTVAMGR